MQEINHLINPCRNFCIFFSHYFGCFRIFCNFATCSSWNEWPKIQKNGRFNKFKNMSNNEYVENKKRQMRRVISIATTLHYAVENLMGMMIAEDEDEDFNLIDTNDEVLYLELGFKADDIENFANMLSNAYKSINQ
nr:MAG TPA: hypothetical protein [Caudoviricetes sp.]